MQKEPRKVIIQTIPLKVEWERVTKFVKQDITLENVIVKYVEDKSTKEDIEIFYHEGNCTVTNKGYHFADDFAYQKEDI